MQIGYKIATESFGPKEVVRQAVAAEEAGFDFVELSDHYHPWLDNQGHSAFTWKQDVLEQFACGPDPEKHLEQVQQFVDAGFDHIVMQNAGPDPDGFMDFWSRELEQPIRSIAS